MIDRTDHLIERLETLGKLAARQQIVTTPLAEAIAKYGTSQEIVSYVKETPFGSFLSGWYYCNQPNEYDKQQNGQK